MKIKMNIEKKHLYIFAIIAALLTAGVFATARFAGTSGVGHDSSEVGVTINGQTVSLQQAINQGLIGGGGSAAIRRQGREKSSTGADITKIITLESAGILIISGTVQTGYYQSQGITAGHTSALVVDGSPCSNAAEYIPQSYYTPFHTSNSCVLKIETGQHTLKLAVDPQSPTVRTSTDMQYVVIREASSGGLGGGTQISIQTATNTCSGTTVCRAFCPAGTKAISGGCILQSSPSGNIPIQNSGLEPASSGTTGSTGWGCAYTNTGNFAVTAIC